ncbi:MAG: wax ester/triacylglycerol synthase family O-acyltransferase [Kineosporiaceae bacterium]
MREPGVPPESTEPPVPHEPDVDARNRAAWAAAAQWGRGETMNELEATMWRAERHPQQSSTICSLMILDRAPDWQRLVAAHDWATSLVPRTRQRVIEPLLPTGPPAWVADRHFTLGYHLRREQLGLRNGLDDLHELVSLLAITPFDRTRPLWEATLIEGLEPEPGTRTPRAAYFLKLHHSLTDGVGAVQLLTALHSRTRRHTSDKPVAAQAVSDDEAPDRLSVTVDGVVRTARAVPGLALGLAQAGRRVVTDPTGAASSGLRFAASLRRVLSPPAAAPSPLFAGRDGRRWVLRTLECPLAALRSAGHAAGGSVNDAYLAVLLGGLRRYHERHGVAIEELPITVPVSLRRADDPMGGNRFAGAMLSGPIGIVDPADRIAAIRGAVLSQLNEPALDSFSVLTPLANRLPSAVGAAVISFGARADLAASNVPGASEPVFLAGARVVRVYPFGPLPGVALMAAMLSHVGTCCIGLTIDAAAVPDDDVLMECLADGLAEVLAP